MKKSFLFFATIFMMLFAMQSCDTNSQLKKAAEQLNKELSSPEFEKQGLKAKSVTYDENTKVFSMVIEVEETIGKQMKTTIDNQPEIGDKMAESFKSSISSDNALVEALEKVGGKFNLQYVLPSGDVIFAKEFTPAELKN